MMTIHKFIRDCILNYAKYDTYTNKYTISTNDLPGFVEYELAALILANDNSLANESISLDNEHFTKHMLPSLLNLLRDSTNKDKEINFIDTWKDCVTSYVKPIMQDLLDNDIGDYNLEQTPINRISMRI